MESHPTINEAIETFQIYVSVPEYSDYKEPDHDN